MNRKGFTLVELLGVVIILAIVMLIAIPNIMTLVERSKKDGYINDARKMVYLVKSEIKKGTVNKPSSEEYVKVTLKDLSTTDLEKDKDGYTYDLEKSYVYITRENGNLVYYAQLVSNKGETYRGILLVNVEDLKNEKRYEKYYENTDVGDEETPEDIYANKRYNIDIATNNIEVSESRVNIRYGRTVTINVEPNEGYYLEKVKCTNGYTTDAEVGVTALGNQTVTIANNSHDYPSVCTFTGKKITYSAALDLIDTQSSKENVTLKFGGSGTVDITPKTGYFLDSVSCTNGYTTNAEVGLEKTGKQTVTIANNSIKNLSTCTFKSLPAYPVVTGGSTTWTTGSRNFKVTKPTPSSEVVRYEYYVSNSNSKPSDSVSVTGTFTSSEVTVSNTGKYIYFRIVYTNGITSKWSEAKDLYVDGDNLNAPTVIGGSTTWKLSKMFMITEPLPASGISRYEYYVSDSSEKPAKTQSATESLMSPSMNIVTGGKYVYFRVVNNAGVTSEWTDAMDLYVDPNTYTITYELNGGTQGDGERTKFDVETSFNLPEAIKQGYEFAGWYENSSLSGNRIDKIELGTRGKKTYYAKWNTVTYNITYELNGGTQADGAPTSYTVDTETFSLPTPTRTGYIFNGWYSATGEGKVTKITKGTSSNTFVYASWTAITYTVKYNANGGTGTMANQEFEYDEEKALTKNSYTRTGYIFLGWSKNASDTGFTYPDEYIISNMTTTDGQVINLYAIWQATSYTITYELNGGTQAALAPTSYTIITETFNLPTPTKSGYNFIGWYENADFTGTKITSITKGTTGNKTYYAKWVASSITYTVYDHVIPDGDDKQGTITLSYSDNFGNSQTLSKSGITEHVFASLSKTVTVASLSKDLVINVSGSYREVYGSTQALSEYHYGGVTSLTIPAQYTSFFSNITISNISVGGGKNTPSITTSGFTAGQDYKVFISQHNDKRTSGCTFSYKITAVLK